MAKTLSEQWFETYLGSRGLAFQYHPVLSGSPRRPDYRVRQGDDEVLCEVSEITTNTVTEYLMKRLGKVVWMDPLIDYGREQRKIDEEGERQLRPFSNNHPVAMVLAAHPKSDSSVSERDMLDMLLGQDTLKLDPEGNIVERGRDPRYPYGMFSWRENDFPEDDGYLFGYLGGVIALHAGGTSVDVYKNPNCKRHPLPDGLFKGKNDRVWGHNGYAPEGWPIYSRIHP